MTDLGDVQAINTRLDQVDPTYNIEDRGQFYLEHLILTNSDAALLQGHISTFSGWVGGAAFAANYLLTDWANNPNAGFQYTDTALGGDNQIYILSQLVAQGFGGAVAVDVGQGNDGSLSESEGNAAAADAWENAGLENQFPGHINGFITSLVSGAQLLTGINLQGNNGVDVAEAGAISAFLFGKSISDFQDINSSDGMIQNHSLITIDSNTVAVIRHDESFISPLSGIAGDRDGNGIIDFNDGIVIAIGDPEFDYIEDGDFSDQGLSLLNGETTGISVWPADSTVQAIRSWQPLKDFRVQLEEGGSTDPEKYIDNFWGRLEAEVLNGDTELRNDFYFYDRVANANDIGNWLYGGKGSDTLTGNNQANYFDGGLGRDFYQGGGGADTYELIVTLTDPDIIVDNGADAVQDRIVVNISQFPGTEISFAQDGEDLIILGNVGNFPSIDVVLGIVKNQFGPDGPAVEELVIDDGTTVSAPINLTALTSDDIGRLTDPTLSGLVRNAQAEFAFTQTRRDPLALDLDDDGSIQLTPRDTLYFDLDSDGLAESVQWINSGDGFLVRDVNSNGLVDNGNELFGDTVNNGFDVLRQFDLNGDSAINAGDAVWSSLKVWHDKNTDGQTQSDELFTLSDLGIQSISLPASGSVGSATTGTETIHVQNMDLLINQVNTRFVGDVDLTPEIRGLPTLRGYSDMPDLRNAMAMDNALKSTIQNIANAKLVDIFANFDQVSSDFTTALSLIGGS